MLGDSFHCHSGGRGGTSTRRIKARDAAKHPTLHRTAPHNKELPTIGN